MSVIVFRRFNRYRPTVDFGHEHGNDSPVPGSPGDCYAMLYTSRLRKTRASTSSTNSIQVGRRLIHPLLQTLQMVLYVLRIRPVLAARHRSPYAPCAAAWSCRGRRGAASSRAETARRRRHTAPPPRLGALCPEVEYLDEGLAISGPLVHSVACKTSRSSWACPSSPMIASAAAFPARPCVRPHVGPTPSRCCERRRPEKTSLHNVVSQNLASWLA